MLYTIKTAFGVIKKCERDKRHWYYKPGDRIVFYPEVPPTINENVYWDLLDVCNHKELCEFGTIICLVGPHIILGKRGIRYHGMKVRFDSGKTDTFFFAYYRFKGKFFEAKRRKKKNISI